MKYAALLIIILLSACNRETKIYSVRVVFINKVDTMQIHAIDSSFYLTEGNLNIQDGKHLGWITVASNVCYYKILK